MVKVIPLCSEPYQATQRWIIFLKQHAFKCFIPYFTVVNGFHFMVIAYNWMQVASDKGHDTFRGQELRIDNVNGEKASENELLNNYYKDSLVWKSFLVFLLVFFPLRHH